MPFHQTAPTFRVRWGLAVSRLAGSRARGVQADMLMAEAVGSAAGKSSPYKC